MIVASELHWVMHPPQTEFINMLQASGGIPADVKSANYVGRLRSGLEIELCSQVSRQMPQT
jgi:hypothetical protein